MRTLKIQPFVAIVLCTCLAGLTGCATTPPPEPVMTISKTTTSTPVVGRATLGEPRPVPGLPVFMIPFSVESEKAFFESNDPFGAPAAAKSPTTFLDLSESGRYSSSSSASYPSYYAAPVPLSMRQVRWHNAVFHNTKTGAESMVLNTRGVIGSWDTLFHDPREGSRLTTIGHVFIAVLEDTNHDGLLDARDARVAIVTDADGSNPRVVSPRDAQVRSLSFDDASRALFLYVLHDSNGDGKFDSADSSVPYRLDLNSREPAKPLVSQATRDKLDALVK